jgi:hypothetical protein
VAAQPRPRARSAAGPSSLPLILIAAALAIGIAALLPLVQSSGVTSTGGRIRHLEQERSDWQARLQEQEIAVARLGSLERIEIEAKTRLKMIPPAETHYIRVDAPGPAQNKVPSRFLQEEPRDTGAGKGLWEEILSWVPVP